MQKRIKRDRRARAACGVVSVLAAVLVLSAGCTPGGASAPSLADMPKVAAGKWRVTIMVDGKGGEFSSDLCEPEKTIDDLLITGLPGNGSNCKDRTFEQVSATSWALHSACNFAGTGDRKAETVVAIDTRVSGDLKSHYQAESKQVMSQPMNGVSQQTILQKAERVGDC